LERSERLQIVIEACPLAEWAARLLEELGHEVVVYDRRRAKAVICTKKKTDKLDAQGLVHGGAPPIGRGAIAAHYLENGPEALEDRRPAARRVWNKLPAEISVAVVELALAQPERSPPGLATAFTDQCEYGAKTGMGTFTLPHDSRNSAGRQTVRGKEWGHCSHRP
jgi:hypothetical protein